MTSTTKKLLPIFLILLIFLISHLGYLTPIAEILSTEAFSFKLGGRQFTAYLIVKSVVAIIILITIARALLDFGEKRIAGIHGISPSNRALVVKTLQITAYFLTFLIALNVLGIDITTFAVVGGAIGIGLGFGLQKITSNFFSGLILLFEKSIEEGDLIELGNGITGFVRRTDTRYTLIETFEGRELMVPNEDFITNQVTNWTFSNTQGRIDIEVGVSYGSDLDLVSKLILEAATEHPRCSHDPEAESYLVGFGDSAVNFALFFWVDDIIEGRKRPKSDVLFTIWRKFKENGIEIPFPQQDVHIKS